MWRVQNRIVTAMRRIKTRGPRLTLNRIAAIAALPDVKRNNPSAEFRRMSLKSMPLYHNFLRSHNKLDGSVFETLWGRFSPLRTRPDRLQGPLNLLYNGYW